MVDYLPQSYYPRQRVKEKLAQHFESYGYQGVELPILEDVTLHLRKTGQGVRRWLYLLQDRAGQEWCLRPEITASVVRSLLPSLGIVDLPLRLHYCGAVFRQGSEQLTQIGVELLGQSGELAEAECIQLAWTGLRELGLTQIELVLGHMEPVLTMAQWITDPRYQDFVIESYSNLGRELPTIEALTRRLTELGLIATEETLSARQKELAQLLAQLGSDQSRILLTGLLEMLQVATEGARDMEEMVQRLVAKLDRETHQSEVRRFIETVQQLVTLQGSAELVLSKLEHFFAEHNLPLTTHERLRDLLKYLAAAGLSATDIQLDFGFGRTLQYYSGLIFELRYQGVLLGGGGRYDGLLRSLGSTVDCPMVGFSYNLEAISQVLAEQELTAIEPPLILYPVDQSHYALCLSWAAQLRDLGLAVLVQPQLGVPLAPTKAVVFGDQIATFYPSEGTPCALPPLELFPVLKEALCP